MTTPSMMSGQAADFGPTPSQTLGPFFALGLTAQQYRYSVVQRVDVVVSLPHAVGENIVL